MDYNFEFFRKINNLQGRFRWLDAFGRAGAEWVIFALVGWFVAGGLYSVSGDVRATFVPVAWLAIAWLVGWGINYIIGLLVHEPRPFVSHPETKMLYTPLGAKSFPSDHAMTAWLVTGLGFLFTVPGFEVFPILALWVSFGRVFAGAHYPFDIVGGFSVAALLTSFSWYLLVLFF
jgi:membrane-associated phospholipid phosphatase